MNRLPGRYKLHRLGWNDFEDLCTQIMKVVLGETCTGFRVGGDVGRDGWYRGVAAGNLLSQNELRGDFVVQCKHTVKADDSLTLSDLTPEVAKVSALAKKSSLHYILMTNRRVGSQLEIEIRDMFMNISGVISFLVLAETWIEDTIDAHVRLLRMVPRLYGIGDLSQILSTTIQMQTAAVLEDLAASLRTFVPTASYRRAEQVLTEHGFAVLVGPPASGKSAIAANLCMVSLAQDSSARVLRIEHADKFKDTWSPNDKGTIYWVDDVFGETTLDDARLREWSAALEKVEAARKRGARILFCTRDYILQDAANRLKKSKLDILYDARVRVKVDSLSRTEKESILYNHVKEGDISKEQKSALKAHLPEIAGFPSFTPELARRLGSRRFSPQHAWRYELVKFFSEPVVHFRDVIHGLSSEETGALAICLLGNNSVLDPIPDADIPTVVLETYGISRAGVRVALERLEGSFVKRARVGTRTVWQFHHPSMIDALQGELVDKSSRFVLYLKAARLNALVRDTTTLSMRPEQRAVFVGAHLYDILYERFCQAVGGREFVSVIFYLSQRSSVEFVMGFDRICPGAIDAVMAIVPDPGEGDSAAYLIDRLFEIGADDAITDVRKDVFVSSVAEALVEHGHAGFASYSTLLERIPELRDLLAMEVNEGFPSVKRLRAWHAGGIDSVEAIESLEETIEAHVSMLEEALGEAGCMGEQEGKVLQALEKAADDARQWLSRRRERFQDEIDYSDVSYGRADAVPAELERFVERSRFSDVDE